MKHRKTDVLIIGAGPSGCVAAAYLFDKGFDVKVVEKATFPRFAIGESLLPRSMDHFEETGLIDCLKSQNFQIKNGARFLKKGQVCHFDFSKKHSPGWDWTWQVPRADFDQALAQEIKRRGIDLAFEEEVTGVAFAGSGHSTTTIKTAAGDTYDISAKFIIDSSGYGRVLPRLLGLDKPSAMPNHSSIFTHVEERNRPEGEEGTLITFDVIERETWLWVIPFSNGKTSIGYVGPTDWLNAHGDTPTKKLHRLLALSKHYRERFKGLDFLFEPKQIVNYAKSVTQLYGKGYALTGNSAGFLDPVFSSGVAFATESGLRAAKLIAQQLEGQPVNWEAEFSDYMKRGMGVFGTYVKEWYTGNLQKIFFHRPENPEVKKQICAVLAGYVWDTSNPFVRNADRLVKTVADFTDIEKAKF